MTYRPFVGELLLPSLLMASSPALSGMTELIAALLGSA
jgi:hypothetical protein